MTFITNPIRHPLLAPNAKMTMISQNHYENAYADRDINQEPSGRLD